MSMGTKPMVQSPILPSVNRYVSPATMQAFPDMYGNPYGQQTNPYAVQQPMNQFGGPSFNQNSGYGPTFANMTGYGNFGGVYQPPQDQMPQRYSNDYNRFLQSGQSFNEPVMGYNSYGQIFAPPRQQPPSFGKGGGGFRPQPPAPSLGGKGGGMTDMQYRGPQQPPVMGGKGQPQNQGPFMSYPGGSGYGGLTARPGSGPPRVPRTRQLGLNNEPSRPGLPDVQAVPFSPQITGGVPQEYAYPTNQQSITMPGQGPVAATGGAPQDNIYNPAYQQQQAASNMSPYQRLMMQDQMRDQFGSNDLGLGLGPMRMPKASDLEIARSLGYTGGPGPIRDMRARLPEEYERENQENNRLARDYLNSIGYGQSGFDSSKYEVRPTRSGPINFGGLAAGLAFQEGGEIPNSAQNMEMMLSEAGPANPQAEMSGEYDRLIQMTMQAVLGQVEQPDEIIQMFIDEFGVDAFRQLRDAVLKQQVPNAQTEGMVDGNGGGMDDQVMGMIGAQRPVAVSPGEYIIPADVVSGLGDGSSKSGADILDELSQAVRMTRTGTTEQPRPLMETLSQ